MKDGSAARGPLLAAASGAAFARGLVGSCVLAAALVLTAGQPAAQQDRDIKNPVAGDPAAIAEGRRLFRTECGLCHGAGARGGNRGPDLTTARWIHGDSDGAIFKTIVGGVAGTEMPANILEDDEVDFDDDDDDDD